MNDHTTLNEVPLKTCNKCGEAKPLTHDYFTKDKSFKSGFYSWCKQCVQQRQSAYYAANKEKAKSYYIANRKRMLASARAWHIAHRRQVVNYYRAWYDANKLRKQAQQKNYRAANPYRHRSSNARWRARLLSAEGSHTPLDTKAQYKRQRGKCYYCKTKLGDSYHVDHVVPLSRGGSNNPENLVIACPTCNTSKRDKLPHEWPQGNRLL